MLWPGYKDRQSKLYRTPNNFNLYSLKILIGFEEKWSSETTKKEGKEKDQMIWEEKIKTNYYKTSMCIIDKHR